MKEVLTIQPVDVGKDTDSTVEMTFDHQVLELCDIPFHSPPRSPSRSHEEERPDHAATELDDPSTVDLIHQDDTEQEPQDAIEKRMDKYISWQARRQLAGWYPSRAPYPYNFVRFHGTRWMSSLGIHNFPLMTHSLRSEAPTDQKWRDTIRQMAFLAQDDDKIVSIEIHAESEVINESRAYVTYSHLWSLQPGYGAVSNVSIGYLFTLRTVSSDLDRMGPREWSTLGNPSLRVVMPQPIVDPKDKVNEYNILLYDWDPTAASSKEILQRAESLFDVQLRLMPDHPASGVLGTRSKLYQVGLVCGYVHT